MTCTIEQEQEAFERQLDELLKTHGGEFVLFKDGAPVGFFPTHVAAYESGIDQFGPDDVFLVSRVEPPQAPSTSLSWDLGVMFG